MHIEKSTKGRDLSPITDDLWKIFYRQLFGAESVDVVISGMKQKNVVFKWRKIYEEKAMERDEAQQKIVEKFRQRYAEDLATLQIPSKVITKCDKYLPRNETSLAPSLSVSEA